MPEEKESRALHLGDGAYVSMHNHGVVWITANHHLRSQATDAVALGPREAAALLAWLQENKT